MNSPLNLQHDRVDEMLKADAAGLHSTYIDDAGFTLRVMDALPARASTSNRLRYGLPFAGAVTAAALAALFSPVGNFMIDATMDVMTQTPTNSAFALLAVVTAMACVAIAGLLGER